MSRPLRWVGRPAVAMAVYAVFLLNIVLHGLVVWSNTAERGAALAVAAALMAGTVVMFRQGLRTPRLAVELRAGEDSDEAATFQVVGGGRPVVAEVQLRYESGEVAVEGASGTVADLVSLRKATFWVPVGGADSLHVWCQRVGAAGEAEALPALVTVRNGGVIRHLDLDLAGGKLLVPIGDEHVTVEFSLVHSTT